MMCGVEKGVLICFVLGFGESLFQFSRERAIKKYSYDEYYMIEKRNDLIVNII